MTDPVTVPPSPLSSLLGWIVVALLVSGSVMLIRGVKYLRRRPLDHPELDTPLRQRPWRGVDVALTILLLFLIQMAIGAWLPHPDPGADADPANRVRLMLLGGIGLHVAALPVILALMIRHRCGWREAFGTHRPTRPLRVAAIFYLGLWPVQVAVVPLYHHLLKRWGHPVAWQEAMVLLTSTHRPLVLLALLAMALVLAPVSEELLFRGILLPVARRRFGLWPAMILTSLVFAGFHLHLPSVAGLFIISMACSLAVVVSGSVLTAIWLHALFNTGSTLLAWLWLLSGAG